MLNAVSGADSTVWMVRTAHNRIPLISIRIENRFKKVMAQFFFFLKISIILMVLSLIANEFILLLLLLN